MNDELSDQLSRLSERHRLAPAAVMQIRALLDVLAQDELAPTTVRDPAAALEVHMADALAALDVDPLRDARAIVDIGAGAGVPGLPIAAALPESTVWLLESQMRKCAFIERAKDEAGIANARIINTRAEQWSAGLGANEVALARAVAPQPIVLEYAAPLLAEGGLLVDWRGRRDEREEAQALRAARELGLERREVRHVTPFPASTDRHLHLYLKVSPTPSRFPRRPGMARKRPLGTATHTLDRDRR